MLTFERKYWAEGFTRIAGVDEAGRGPLAGPVVAAAVILGRDFAEGEEHGELAGIDDSKKLTPARRAACCERLQASPRAAIGLGLAATDEIDRLNILRATHLAMQRAVAALPGAAPDLILVDGLPVPGLPCRSEAIVGGDARSLSIAAASIVAKVTRDRMMEDLDRLYPQYGFAGHKGYGTSTHIQALFEHGPCPEHRRGFGPVRDAAALHRRRGPRDAP